MFNFLFSCLNCVSALNRFGARKLSYFLLFGALNLFSACTQSSTVNPSTGVVTYTLTPAQTAVSVVDQVTSWVANEVISLASKI